jgi:hypothetical protein
MTKTPGGDCGSGSPKVVRVVVKELDDDVAPDGLKSLSVAEEIICKLGSADGV